jgi:uncharacterized membrane protein HdeD (DUF308 family)
LNNILSYGRSPGWVRAAQVILGILTIILSVFALAFPGYTFLSVIVILSIVLFFVGIEKIITGIFLPQRSKWATIGLGVLVLIFAGLAIAYPATTAFVVIIFIGVALLFSGIARIIEGVSGHHSGWSRLFLIGVGVLAVILSFPVMASPAFGAALAGVIIAIALLIIGIQMVVAGVSGQKFRNPADKYLHA